MLGACHGRAMSMRTLKRMLRDFGLKQYGVSAIDEIWNAVHSELRGPGILGILSLLSVEYLLVC